ncbi:MAG: hypothetical protein HZA52_03315 [Planctomycetes bacterium]|nr:hypothetical protein [Planctomycetota bacterium]
MAPNSGRRTLAAAMLVVAALLAILFSSRYDADVDSAAPSVSDRAEIASAAHAELPTAAGEVDGDLRQPASAPSSLPTSGTSGMLTIRVTDEAGRPLDGAWVEFRMPPEVRQSVRRPCDANGELRVSFSDAAPDLRYVQAGGNGFASAHLIGPDLEGSSEAPLLVVQLRPAASVRIELRDTDARLLARHAVVLEHSGQLEEPSLLGHHEAPSLFHPARHADVLVTRVLISNEHGVVDADDLAAGWWSVHAPDWRDCRGSEWHVVALAVGQNPALAVDVPRRPTASYASGRVAVPAEFTVAEDSTYRDFGLRTTTGGHGAFIHHDGAFFAPGKEGSDVELVIRDDLGDRTSAPFVLRIGRHGYELQPTWP